MTSVSGISYSDYYLNRYKGNYSSYNDYVINHSTVNGINSDQFVSANGETCTDGKDDGKIGFFAAIGNAIKGVAKTVVNGVKGMFTDGEGKFSLGKTLLSIGTAALCIAFPAVGVAACAVGAVAGGIQVGKGIYNAATAKTDAEAKEAWQNIGGGGFTVAMSVVGAKAGIKSMKASSTAANGLNSLGKDATLGAKAKAFMADAKSSTVNNFKALKGDVTTLKEVAELRKANSKASKVKGAATDKEIAIQKEAEIRNAFASDSAKSVNAKIDNGITKVQDVAKARINSAKSAKNPVKSIASNVKNNGGIKATIVKNVRSLPSRLKPIAEAINEEGKFQAIQKYGYNQVAEVLKIAGGYALANENI